MPIMTAGLSLMKNVPTLLAKSVIVPLWLIVTASATYATIQNKIFGSGTMLVFSIEDLNNITKIVKSLEDAGLMVKVVTGKVKNEVKQQKPGFLDILDATLSAS